MVIRTIVKIALFPVMTWVIVAAFVYPPPQEMIGEASRIFYFHVPQAMVAVVAFVVSMIASIRYLVKRKSVDDDRARIASGLGLLFAFLATVTGSIFAKVTWQSFWNWDPRETSILILLLIYGAYFALRSAVESGDKRARLAAVYSIFAFITVPFLMFVIPRVLPSLHPSDSIVDASGKIAMSNTVLMIFVPSIIAFIGLFFWIYNIAIRAAILERISLREMRND